MAKIFRLQVRIVKQFRLRGQKGVSTLVIYWPW